MTQRLPVSPGSRFFSLSPHYEGLSIMFKSAASAARQIVDSMQKSYSAPQTLTPVSEADFPRLDLAKYQSFRTDMEVRGFRYVADLEILELSQSTTTLLARTMIRSMISTDGSIALGYYQIKPRIWRSVKLLATGLLNFRFIDAPRNFLDGMRTKHCIDFETEFVDGRFLITSNAQLAGLISGPPTIESNYFSFGTPVSVLFDFHRKRLDEILSSGAGIKPAALSSVSEILQMQKRQSTQKAAYRAAVQWVTKEELQGISFGHTDLGNEVFSEVQKLLNDPRSPT